MAPLHTSSPASLIEPRAPPSDPWNGRNSNNQIIVEAWGQGLNVGALVFITLVVLCNYRQNVLLHKLILLELILAVWHGFFIFFPDPAYGWILSATAIPLYISYTLHNIVAWIKIKPFLPRWGGLLFIITLGIVQPYWVLESWANFYYFNDLGHHGVFKKTRYLEPLVRDPWWIFTTVKLVLVINKNYDYTLIGLVRTSPRFGVMLLCMFVSIAFILTDIIVTARVSVQSGINPFWRLALVFKCASDAIFLDDFKSVLDRIAASAMKYVANLPHSSMGTSKDNNPSSGGRRRGSSIGFRRPSLGARFSSNQPRNVVHISAENGPNSGSAFGTEERPNSSRNSWRSIPFSSPRGMANINTDISNPHRHIRADTTITISEDDELDPKFTNVSAHGRTGSQDRILTPGLPTSTPPDYGWGEPPGGGGSRSNDAESDIPMVPMRARISNRFG